MRVVYRLMLLIVALMACMLSAQAQSHKLMTEDNDFTYSFPETNWETTVNVHRSVYYDKDDKKTPHGPFTAKGVEKLDKHKGHYNSSGKFIPKYRVTADLTYTASGNYKEGKLDGVIKLRAFQNYTKPSPATYDYTLTAQFDNGVPCGTWTASCNVNDGSDKRSFTYIATMDKSGKISSIRNSAGTCTFKATGEVDIREKKENSWGGDSYIQKTEYDIYEVTGKWGGINYVKSYNMDEFRRLNGDVTKPDEEALAVLKALSSGTMSHADALAKGYNVADCSVWNEDFLSDFQNVVSELSLSWFDLTNGYKRPSTMCHKWQLERVKLLSYDEVLKKLGDKGITDNDLQTINENYIVVKEGWNGNVSYYFNNEVKEQLIALWEEKVRNEAYVDSLASKLTALNQRLKQDYSKYSVFQDELNVVETHCCSKEILDSRDTTKLQLSLKIAETIAGTLDMIIDGYWAREAVLDGLKSDPELHGVVEEISKYSGVDNPNDLERATAYFEIIKTWRAGLDQLKISVTECEAIREQSRRNSSLIKASKCPNLLSVYNSATEPKLTKDMDANISKAKAWVAYQKDFVLIDSLYNEQLRKDEAIIQKCGKPFADIKKTYTKAKSEIDVAAKTNLVMTTSNLRKLNTIQDGCLAFLQEKEKVLATDQQLAEQGKSYKNIAKVYQKYIKDTDLNWTPGATTATLQIVQQVQRVIGEAYASPKAEELDKMVKQDKNKTIENILVIIQKNK